MASDKAVEEGLEALSKLDRAYSPSLNRDISQTTAHPIVFEVKADRRRETKYHLEYKHRQTEKQNAILKRKKTECNFENDFWSKSYNSRFMGFQEVT